VTAVPTVEEVDAIGAITDPVIRNLRITQCYHELSGAVAERVAPGANWCTFATWASRQAGQTIRGEDFERAAADILGSPEIAELIAGVVRIAARDLGAVAQLTLPDAIHRILDPERALRRAADAVAAGNRKVFVEIGREFARWRATAAATGTPDAAATTAFCNALRPGEPPDGQRLLRDAFVAYADACRAPNGGHRASLLLLANLLIGLHEQTRLQPEIEASLNASLDADSIRAELLALIFSQSWLKARAEIARVAGRPLPADVAVRALVAAVQRRVRVVITEMLMTLRLPGATLHLGRDVPGGFPPELREITHPPLVALLARVDPTPNATAGSGATDWASLPERMHFITDLFRCWHGRAELFTSPYEAAQVAAMRTGRRPDGDL
jgi:hypothetical protein